jgi:hypothetical protein
VDVVLAHVPHHGVYAVRFGKLGVNKNKNWHGEMGDEGKFRAAAAETVINHSNRLA